MPKLWLAAVLIAIVATATDAQLATDFYANTCPTAVKTVADIVGAKIRKDGTVAAGLLRLQFHDCFVRGCDASLLIDSTSNPSNVAEKEGLPNINSVRGYEIIDEAKTAIEAACPGVVSCADIVALASRNAVNAIGGPWWNVPLGRRDGVVSLASETLTNLPPPDATYAQLVSMFKSKGLTEREMVILSGGHTIGKVRCLFFLNRLYNFPGSPDGVDPTLNSTYAAELKNVCKPGDSTTKVPFDPSLGGNRFDSNYYTGVKQGKGVIKSDAVLRQNTFLMDRYSAAPIMPFFWDFAQAMEKMSKMSVLTGTQGEIRLKCSVVNPKTAPPPPATNTTAPPPPAFTNSTAPPPAPATATPPPSTPPPSSATPPPASPPPAATVTPPASPPPASPSTPPPSTPPPSSATPPPASPPPESPSPLHLQLLLRLQQPLLQLLHPPHLHPPLHLQLLLRLQQRLLQLLHPLHLHPPLHLQLLLRLQQPLLQLLHPPHLHPPLHLQLLLRLQQRLLQLLHPLHLHPPLHLQLLLQLKIQPSRYISCSMFYKVHNLATSSSDIKR
ncbi:hypothetical protein Mapa_013222 [Marchantia paleacea]|nr:hypothetical protein Mapa_013222 [Marchantia paleacea]